MHCFIHSVWIVPENAPRVIWESLKIKNFLGGWPDPLNYSKLNKQTSQKSTLTIPLGKFSKWNLCTVSLQNHSVISPSKQVISQSLWLNMQKVANACPWLTNLYVQTHNYNMYVQMCIPCCLGFLLASGWWFSLPFLGFLAGGFSGTVLLEGLSALLAHTKEGVHSPATNCLSRLSISDWLPIVSVKTIPVKIYTWYMCAKKSPLAAILPQ